MKAREVCPDKPSSMFEIGYLIMGRSSIFAICFTIWINSFFLIIIFISVWGETAETFVSDLRGCKHGLNNECGEIFGSPYSYMILIAVVLIPTTLMKEIAELHIVSMSLFGSALLFVLINIIQMFVRPHVDYSNLDVHYSKYLWPEVASSSGIVDLINGIATIFTACNFQVNLFPIHSNQIDKTIKGTVKIISITMLLCQIVYFALSISVIFNYGSLLADVCLDNIADTYPVKCIKSNPAQLADVIKDTKGNIVTGYPDYYV